MDRQELSSDALLILLAMQLFPKDGAVDPKMCILLQRPAASGEPQDYRLMIADHKEEWTYAMTVGAKTVQLLANGGFLKPCELEDDPREHYVFTTAAIEKLSILADNIRRSVTEAGLGPPPGAH